MANVFNRRGQFFGRPDLDAASGIASTIGGLALADAQRQIADENKHQVAKAKIAFLAEQDNFKNTFQTENADRPDLWAGALKENEPTIRKSVLDGVYQPGARRDVTEYLDAQFANWRSSIATASRSQQLRNEATDFKLGNEAWNKPRSYERAEHIIEDRDNYSSWLDDSPRLTDDEKLAAVRNWTKNQVGNHLLNNGSEASINNPNVWIDDFGLELPSVLGGEQEIFDSEDVAELKGRFGRAREGAIADNENARKELGERTASELEAQISTKNIPINDIQRSFAEGLDAGLWTAPQIRTLRGSIESRITNAGKTASLDEKARATDEYETLQEAGKLDEAKAVALRDAWMHTEAVTRGRLDEIAKAKANPDLTTDPALKEFLSISENIETQVTAALKARTDEDELDEAGVRQFADDTATIGMNRLNRNTKIREIYKREDIDEKKKRELAQEVVLPAQQEAAKNVTGSIWRRLFRNAPTGFTALGGSFGGPLGSFEKITSRQKHRNRVRVRKPDGTVGTISRENLKEAKAAGYKVVE
jgi:hypothetical protein